MRLTDEQKTELVEKYKTGKYTCFGLDKFYRIAKGSSLGILNRRKIPINNDRSKLARKYTLNENYFDFIDTEEKAYFLGLMYADGYNSGKAVVSIKLQEKDKEILEKFNIAIESNQPLSLVKYKHKNLNWQDQYKLNISSKIMVNALTKLGCVPRKSLVLKFPTEEQVPSYLLRHFIRGIFDGDGSFGVYKNGSNSKTYTVTITSTEDFCIGLKNLLKNSNFKIRIPHKKKGKSNSTRDIRVQKKEECFKFLSWMYNDATIYLNRKYKKYTKELKDAEIMNTDLIMIIDKSSSMRGRERDVINAYNKILNISKEENNKKHKVRFSSYLFSDTFVRSCELKDIGKVKEWTQYDYRPYGNTNLYETVIEAISEYNKNNAPGNSVLMYVLTDGMNNVKGHLNINMASLIREMQGTDRWTFAFQVPKGHENYIIDAGVYPGNVSGWDTTTQDGYLKAANATSVGTQSYFKTRGAGGQSMSSFYVQTDIGNIPKAAMKSVMDDLSKDYYSYTVLSEQNIKSFVEDKGINYKKGIAFYELTKKEEVQPSKEVLVGEKNTKKLYGGEDARQVLGITPNTRVKVNPGYHGNYKIYVQSTSVNRKLVPGTNVLVKK